MSEFVFLLSTFYCGQLILLGVCCSGSGDGMDPYAEVSLQPLPEYTIPSDGVTMTCITCTDRGHVFLAGRDGHIYELQYTTGSGWHKRCRKVCLTAGLGSVISRYHFLLKHLQKFMVMRFVDNHEVYSVSLLPIFLSSMKIPNILGDMQLRY